MLHQKKTCDKRHKEKIKTEKQKLNKKDHKGFFPSKLLEKRLNILGTSACFSSFT